MSVIGVTGGIGTGKSTVMQLLRDLGAVTFSADEAAREVLAPGSDGLKEVAASFGVEFLNADGSLDRGRLAAAVFADPAARRKLEQITHPRILALLRKSIEEVRRRSSAQTVIAVEAPLLFEAGMEDWFDAILVITASERNQVRRAVDRSGISEEEARARISAQIPLEEKASRASFVIHNDGTMEELRASVGSVWKELDAGGASRAGN